MDFYNLSLAIVAATISYIVYGKVVRVQENKTLASKSSSSSHTTNLNQTALELNQTELQENTTIVSSPSPPPQNWEYHVFVSFRGEDVRIGFLSHILKEFRRKGINPFMDNEMKKGGSISPELKRAIKGSKIAIVVISKDYASSSWCLNELVKIIKCRRKIGQKVITIFYQVEPTDVKKQAGEFGKVFKNTCKGKTYKLIQKWKEALVEVATIVGYDSTKWVDEASAIEEVANDISKMLNLLAPSHYLDPLIGMEAHMKEMQLLLRLDLVDDVRMIGIWGPLGIGKSTISRYMFNQLSNNFQLTALMVNIKKSYSKPCLDEGSAQLKLQEKMLSMMLSQKDIVITHLGVAQDRLKDKKVLLVLDDVDEHAQLVALAENIMWFGPGSRIIIATENLRVLLTHGIMKEHIYKVKYPSSDEAFEIFCMYAFRQKVPDEGFTELARQVTYLAGNLPLGLQIMGSYFLRRPKNEWIEALPNLWSRLDGKIDSVLKFSYDALSDEYKYLFLLIACFFNGYEVKRVEAYLAETFKDVRQRLQVLAEKSLISLESGSFIEMHKLLVQLGQEIVTKFNDCTTFTGNEIGISYECDETWDEFTISDKVFEGRSDLQFLSVRNSTKSPVTLSVPGCLVGIPSKLRFLRWDYFPLTCWPMTVKLENLVELNMPVKLENLVELNMRHSKLKKLWEGIKPLKRLKWMDLSYSKNLRKLPNLSTATSLEELCLNHCTSLVELPSSIGNAIKLKTLDLSRCSSLVELPCSIGNATNLQTLNLCHCSNLTKLPYYIGGITNLKKLDLRHCSSLVELSFSIGGMTNLNKLDLSHCSSLVDFSIGNSTNLQILNLSHCSSLVKLSIKNAINLEKLNLSYCSSLVELTYFIENATNFQKLDLNGCSSLVKLQTLDLCHCTSLMEIHSSIGNLHMLESLLLRGCSKLEFLPFLPSNINIKTLKVLDLSDCLLLKTFPEISTNIEYLYLKGTAVEEIPSSIRSWSRLCELCMPYSERFMEMPHALATITYLDLTDLGEIQELGTWIKGFTRLEKLVLNGMKKLLSIPQLPNSLYYLDAENCESLERIDYSFCNPEMCLNFRNCLKLNQEVRDLIIQTSTFKTVILYGGEIPTYFNYRNSGNSLTVKLNEKEPLHTSRTYRACVLIVNEGDWEFVRLSYTVASKYNDRSSFYRTYKGSKGETSSENLFIFDVKTNEVTSTELVFKFRAEIMYKESKVEIKECGVVQISKLSSYEEDTESSYDDEDTEWR